MRVGITCTLPGVYPAFTRHLPGHYPAQSLDFCEDVSSETATHPATYLAHTRPLPGPYPDLTRGLLNLKERVLDLSFCIL